MFSVLSESSGFVRVLMMKNNNQLVFKLKKFLLYSILGLFYCNTGVAQLIEFEKCLPTEGRFPVKNWSESEWNKRNLFVKVSKNVLLKNYKNWGFDKLLSRDYIDIFAKEYPELNYIALTDYNYTYPENQKSKLISINADFLTRDEKNIYSIDINSGTITHIRIKSEDYLQYMDDYYKKKGSIFDFARKKTDTTKWVIDSYAGGIIVGYMFSEATGNILRDSPITIDVQNKSISFQFGADSKTHTKVCKSLEFVSSDEISTSSGTAFFINNKGNLLTNHHVINKCKEIKVNYFDNEYDASLLAVDKILDLALLKVDVTPKSYLKFSNYHAKKLQRIYVAGYPFGKGLSDDLKISSGIISSLKGLKDNSNELQIDAAINNGNSGGPIVGEGGELVAIAVSGLAKEVSEGINFGIKSSAAVNFLGANDINVSKINKSNVDSDDLLTILEESTLFILCIY